MARTTTPAFHHPLDAVIPCPKRFFLKIMNPDLSSMPILTLILYSSICPSRSLRLLSLRTLERWSQSHMASDIRSSCNSTSEPPSLTEVDFTKDKYPFLNSGRGHLRLQKLDAPQIRGARQLPAPWTGYCWNFCFHLKMVIERTCGVRHDHNHKLEHRRPDIHDISWIHSWQKRRLEKKRDKYGRR